jgi:hypothetical protein
MRTRQRASREIPPAIAAAMAARAKELMGDPLKVLAEQRKHERDHRYLQDHIPEWRENHAGKWVAVRDLELVAVSENIEGLRTALAAIGLSFKQVRKGYVHPEPYALVL